MLMVAAAGLVLWQAGVMNDMSRCRTVKAEYTGPEVAWETNGKGWLWISTTAAAFGRIELRCRIPVTPGVAVVVEMERVFVSFAGAQSRNCGSGVSITARDLSWELLRIAGEDWIEAKSRRIVLKPSGSELVLTIAAIDQSNRDPMRIDLHGLRMISPTGAGH
jgi:hypothetical protein